MYNRRIRVTFFLTKPEVIGGNTWSNHIFCICNFGIEYFYHFSVDIFYIFIFHKFVLCLIVMLSLFTRLLRTFAIQIMRLGVLSYLLFGSNICHSWICNKQAVMEDVLKISLECVFMNSCHLPHQWCSKSLYPLKRAGCHCGGFFASGGGFGVVKSTAFSASSDAGG